MSERTGGGGGGHYYNSYGRGEAGTNVSDQEREAASLFNAIKETFTRKIDELNELKRQVFLLSNG